MTNIIKSRNRFIKKKKQKKQRNKMVLLKKKTRTELHKCILKYNMIEWWHHIQFASCMYTTQLLFEQLFPTPIVYELFKCIILHICIYMYMYNFFRSGIVLKCCSESHRKRGKTRERKKVTFKRQKIQLHVIYLTLKFIFYYYSTIIFHC